MEFLIDSRRLGANGSGLLDTVFDGVVCVVVGVVVVGVGGGVGGGVVVVVVVLVVCAQIVALEKIARRQRDWMSCMFVE